MLKLEVVREAQRLHEISGAWQTLTDRIDSVTPLQSPDWLLKWWHHFGSGELRSLAFWQDGQLVGLIPLFLHEWNGRRQLTLAGSGLTDYLEPCTASAEVYDSLSVQLRNDSDWDLCDWQDLAAGTPLQRLDGLTIQVKAEMPCSAIPLAGSFEEYWQLRSADLRRNIKRYARKAEGQGALEFLVADHSEAALLETLIRLHGERWRHQGEPGMVEVNQSSAFLRDVTTLESCRFFILRWKGEMVAATAGFLKGKTVYSYLSAFDPQFEILGFGRNLLYRSLQWAFQNDYEHWDFLRGDEPYKASWGAIQTPKCRVLITRS